MTFAVRQLAETGTRIAIRQQANMRVISKRLSRKRTTPMSSTITTEQVKQLRDATSVSVMQCRKALEEAEGDMDKAIIILRKKGGEMAGKKADRSASDGTIVIKSDDHRAITLMLNCETDFVAKNDRFQE